jgi:hypothetical protein
MEPCTYHLPEVFLDTDLIPIKEEIFIRNCIYRQEILNFFNLEEFDDTFLEIKIKKLYKQIIIKEKVFEFFLDLIQRENYFSFLSKEQCFLLLFSYDFFWITQLCLKDYLETGNISEARKTVLLEKIKYFSINE